MLDVNEKELNINKWPGWNNVEFNPIEHKIYPIDVYQFLELVKVRFPIPSVYAIFDHDKGKLIVLTNCKVMYIMKQIFTGGYRNMLTTIDGKDYPIYIEDLPRHIARRLEEKEITISIFDRIGDTNDEEEKKFLSAVAICS